MKRSGRGVTAWLVLCAAAACGGAEAPFPVASRPASEFPAIDKALRGEDVGAYTLQKALIRIEQGASAPELNAGLGVEEGAAAPAAETNVFILGFGDDCGAAEELEVLKLQREALSNQLMLIRSVRELVDRQLSLGARSARIEGAARDVHAGMIASHEEVDALRGESAGNSIRASVLAEGTVRRAETMRKVAKALSETTDTLQDCEMEVHEMRRGMRR